MKRKKKNQKNFYTIQMGHTSLGFSKEIKIMNAEVK